nr:ORF60 [Bracoviriform inaniti]
MLLAKEGPDRGSPGAQLYDGVEGSSPLIILYNSTLANKNKSYLVEDNRDVTHKVFMIELLQDNDIIMHLFYQGAFETNLLHPVNCIAFLQRHRKTADNQFWYSQLHNKTRDTLS